MLTAGGLSAIFSNDVVCLAMAPWVARLSLQRGLKPVPMLVGLACAANIGSAASLIGNPQNMLIGSVMKLSFSGYFVAAALPVALSLLAAWAWLARGLDDAHGVRREGEASGGANIGTEALSLDRAQAFKGLAVAGVLMLVFALAEGSREVAALLGAGFLLLSRRLHSARVLAEVDGSLLLLFIGLFIVNDAFAATGLAAQAVAWMKAQGVVLSEPGLLLVLGAGLSNLVSNVPAVMLMLPHVQSAGPQAGMLLALASSFAGNLLLVGSIANLIVADLAQREGVPISWRAHAALGLPVGLLSLTILWLTWTMGA
jgi:Na+/H+ antiporter NhaD/arsenite permease-like protein